MIHIISKLNHIEASLNKKLKASITVEAAFSFTLTVFVVFLLLGPLLIIKNTSDLMIKLNEASKKRCTFELVKRNANNLGVFQSIKQYIGDTDTFDSENLQMIENTIDTATFLLDINSDYDASKSEYRNIDWIYDRSEEIFDKETGLVTYDYDFGFKLPYNLLHVNDIKLELFNQRRAFIGSVGNRFESLSENGEYVYVANNYTNSSVYHTKITCSYLIKDTFSFSYIDRNSHKNESNHRYSKCDYCFRKIKLLDNTTCYATKYGEKFHYRENCPLMTAYITKIPKEYIDEYGLRECTRCKKKGE